MNKPESNLVCWFFYRTWSTCTNFLQ